MSRFDDVQQFVDHANRITTFQELSDLLRSVATAFGFDYFAMVHHHINLAKASDDTIHLYNYPDAWVGTIIERDYFSDDPIHAACQKTAVGFLWSDVARLVQLTPRQKEILAAAGYAGMGEGFTVPVHLPGEYNGSCSFGTRFGRKVSPSSLPAAHYVGTFAFEAARRILRHHEAMQDKAAPVRKPMLSQRQFDCLVLAAKGKSDVDIATLLGISVPTVHQHIETAKRRYNVASRTTLVVRALFDNQVTFADIFR